MLQLVLDSRESHLQKELANFSYVQEELTVGDIIIKDVRIDEENNPNEKIILIIERKTVDDFLGGIKSGRFREQRERLKATGCKCCYIVENYGKLSYSDISKVNIISGAIENLIVYHDISVIPTLNLKHTAHTLLNIFEKIRKQLPEDRNISPENVVPVFTQKKTKVLEHIHEHQLILVPGVSAKSAKVISEKYPTVKSLVSAYETLDKPEEKWNLLADIFIGKKKIGKVVSRRIFDIYGC